MRSNARRATTLMLGRATRSATQPQDTSALVRARELRTFVLDDWQHDVRGWPVYTREATRVGSVAALFVDIHCRRVRYVGVELAGSGAAVGTAGCVLVPVGAARRVDERGFVVLGTLSARQLADAPRLAARPVTRADEDATLAAYGMCTSRMVPGVDLYGGPAFDDRPLLGALSGD